MPLVRPRLSQVGVITERDLGAALGAEVFYVDEKSGFWTVGIFPWSDPEI